VKNTARGIRIQRDFLGREVESETFTCPHCNAVKAKPAPGAPCGWCHRCFGITCLECEAVCTPFEKKIEQYEQRQRLLAAAANA